MSRAMAMDAAPDGAAAEAAAAAAPATNGIAEAAHTEEMAQTGSWGDEEAPAAADNVSAKFKPGIKFKLTA